jgi:hypothetical protein
MFAGTACLPNPRNNPCCWCCLHDAHDDCVLVVAGAGMMAVPRAYLQVGWLMGTAMLLGVVSVQLAARC